ncbi:alpha/beta fold hydrolase, partial [Xanthovirga aplysinae]|uniref:alpha/beta fold hydrolase n=1 Tax=Xanthovirga aplysinae TaxID=2529853 RepID=UPI0012BB5C5C
VLSGGPGNPLLTPQRVKNWLKSPVRKKRDIILLDQRGMGYSSSLPNMNDEIFKIFAKDTDEKEDQLMMDELIFNYKQKCIKQNIQLQHYNTFQNAKDIGLLMKHLNYKKYNLYGVSYGTRLGRVIQDMYPNYLNAVILNSPNPMQGDFLIDRLKSYSLALDRVFAYCANNDSCFAENPNLKQDYFTAIESLKKKPLKLDINGKSFFLNAQEGVFFLRRVLYWTDSRNLVPKLIKEYLNGGGPLIKNLVQYEFEPGFNFAMWLAVERYEMFNPENSPEVIDEFYETLPLLPVPLGLFSPIYHAMGNLHDESLSKHERTFQVSDVPTMITVNRFDPVTPPENGHILMEKLTNGQLFILDEGGHGGGNEKCRANVMISFMDNPRGNLDTSCLNLVNEKMAVDKN